MSLAYVLMFLRAIEASIMIISIGVVVYFLINHERKNIHLSNGRPYVAIFLAIGWAKWTYNFMVVDYKFFFELGKVLQSTTLESLIETEVLNIWMTILNAMMLLGYVFKEIKKDK